MSQVRIDAVHAALRSLADGCQQHGLSVPAPEIVRLRADDTVEVHLHSGHNAPLPPPWQQPPAGGAVWEARLDQIPAPVASTQDLFAALCLLGEDSAGGQVLLNLPQLPVLTVAGPQVAVLEVLAGLVAEIDNATLGELPPDIQVWLVGVFPRLISELAGGHVHYTPSMADYLASAAARRGQEIVVCASPIPHSEGAQLAELMRTRPGLAVLCSDVDGVPVGEHVLRLADDGRLSVLEPVGWRIDPMRLPADSFPHIVLPPKDEVFAPPAAAAFMPPATTEPAPVDAPRFLMLGTPDLVGATGTVSSTKRRRALELGAFLLFHPQASTGEIHEALWPGRPPVASTRHTFISVLRKWLGTAPDGSHWLPQNTTHDGYQYTAGVGSDVQEFLSLIDDRIPHMPTEQLEAAAGLVRGRPFDSPSGYGWAADLAAQVSDLIVQVFTELGQRRINAGQWAQAGEAAQLGLVCSPSDQALWRIRLRAAGYTGLTDGLLSELHEATAGVALDPETSRLRDEITVAGQRPAAITPPFAPAPLPETVSADPVAGADIDPALPTPQPGPVIGHPVLVLPPERPDHRRKGRASRRVLMAAACLGAALSAGAAWMVLQPSPETPVAAQPPVVPVPQVDAQPGGRIAVVGIAPRQPKPHPAMVQASVRWGTAAQWQERKEAREAARRAVVVPVPWAGPDTGNPSTGSSAEYTPPSSGWDPPSSPPGGTSNPTSGGGNPSVVIRPAQPGNGGESTSTGPTVSLPDQPDNPTNPDAG